MPQVQAQLNEFCTDRCEESRQLSADATGGADRVMLQLVRHVCPECGESGDPGVCAKDDTTREPAGIDTLLGTTIGSWRVTRLLGAGGMGRVYQAVQPAIGARVAIKVMKESADRELVERFFNEARAVNMIRHEAIVDIIDLGRLPSGAPYIVMEFLEGVPLRALFRADPRLPLGTLGRCLADVLAALEVAHAKGVVHRDLKPDNVFVSPGGRITVLDFGIAKLVADQVGATPTQTGSLLGTPAYMSPEQARAQPLDARADLYAVGVMLYEGATGVLPFQATSLYDLLDMHVKAAPVSPRAHAPAIPEAVEAVILRALAKEPGDRFASAAEMRRALLAAVDALPRSELVVPALARDTKTVPSDPLAATVLTGADVGPPPGVRDGARSGRRATDVARDPALALSETLPSGTGTPTANAAVRDRSVRTSPLILGALAGAAALGIAATAFLVLRDPSPRVIVAQPPLADAALALMTDAPEALDAGLEPVAVIVADAAQPDAVAVAVAPKPKPPPPQVEPPPDLTKGPIMLTVGSPNRFDPVAYYKVAVTKARWALGGEVWPIRVTYRLFDRAGRVDLTAGGAADYLFRAAAPKNEYCYVNITSSAGSMRLAVGSSSAGCNGRTAPPRCTIPQLWERALAKGFPATATHANANKMGRDWVFSGANVESIYIDDDC